MTLRWKARIRILGVNPYVIVSRARAGELRPNWKRPIPVRVQVNGRPGEPGRVNLVPVGDGSFYLYLNGTLRRASATSVGDTVEVAVALDRAYRGGPVHPMPGSFAAGLAADAAARAAWRALVPSAQKEVLRYLAALKSEAARERNVERALRVLGGARERFLGRLWNGPVSLAPRRKRPAAIRPTSA